MRLLSSIPASVHHLFIWLFATHSSILSLTMLGNTPASRRLLTTILCILLSLSFSTSSIDAEELCSIIPDTYTAAMATYPELSTALNTMKDISIASWYTDRKTSQDRARMLSRMLSQCSDDTRLSIAVYGLPNKDCAAGFSTSGSVSSTKSYRAFLKELTDAVGNRKVLYVVEPDAVGLLIEDGGCGASAGYLENLKIAVAALSANVNAELYVDVGYWTLAHASSASKIATVMKQLGHSGRVKGVTINTSNYRSNQECAKYCTNFQRAMNSTDMTCIVDTSRNHNGSPTTDWCNVPTAGIGRPPTSNTGYSNLDYFMWIKPPGESDGECLGGPIAGAFFLSNFKLLWNQGYFVRELGMPRIGGAVATAAPVPNSPMPSSAITNPPSTSTGSVHTSDAPTSTIIPRNTAAPTEVPRATTGPIARWPRSPNACRPKKRLRPQ